MSINGASSSVHNVESVAFDADVLTTDTGRKFFRIAVKGLVKDDIGNFEPAMEMTMYSKARDVEEIDLLNILIQIEKDVKKTKVALLRTMKYRHG